MGKNNRKSNASQASSPGNQKPAPTPSKPTPAKTAPASNAKPTPGKREAPTPSSSTNKKMKEEEKFEDEDDSEDERELSELMAANGEGDDDDDEDDDEDGQVFDVPDFVLSPTYVNFSLPPGGTVTVMANPNCVVSLVSATLGLVVEGEDRSALIASVSRNPPALSDEEMEEMDEEANGKDEEDEEEEDDEEGEIENLVLGTLIPKFAENLALDVTFSTDFMLNNVSKQNSIHIVALVENAGDCDDDVDMDDEEDDMDATFNTVDDESDEEEKPKAPEPVKAAEPKKAAEPAKKAEPAKAAAKAPEAKKSEPAAKPVEAAKKPEDKKAARKEAKKEEKKDPANKKATINDVVDFVLGQLKAVKGGSAKQADIGASLVSKFGQGVKAMGFEEKSLTKLLEVHAKGKVLVEKDVYRIA